MTFLHLSVFVSWTVIVSAEQLSYVVTSKPYYIKTSENVGKLQRDFHHENIGENEISETMENENTHCELGGACGGDIAAGNFDATFKPFPQNELEKILRKYGKDKASDRIFNSKGRPSSSNDISSALSFQPVTPEKNSYDKSKSWSLLNADVNEDKQADKGWVTLEPVAWSSSQIQKWKPSIQSVDDQDEEIEQEPPHWKNPIASKPQFDSLGWNPNKHPWHSSKPTSHDNSKPDYEYEKPTNLYNNEHNYEPVKSSFPPMKHMKPTYDPLKPIYDSIKPTYEPIETTIESIKGVYDKPTFNSIKPTLDALGLTYSSGKPNYESIKTSLEHSHKPFWNQNYEAKPGVTKVQPSWNSQLSTESRPQIITAHNQDQFASYLQNQPQHPSMFEQNNQLSMQGTDAPESDGHWVLLSSTREYGGPDRQRNLSRSLKSKEFYRNAIPLTIYNPEIPSRKLSRAIDHSDYKNYIPLTRSVGNSSEFRRQAIPLIITAPHLSQYTPGRHERKLESPPQDTEESSRTARRMVRLTVLPPVNGSHTVTSHNGMIEVEDTKLTVDESHRQHLTRMMSLQQRSAGGRLERDMTSYPQRDVTSYHPGKVSMVFPGALVRRRRRFEPGHGSFYPRIQTATH